MVIVIVVLYHVVADTVRLNWMDSKQYELIAEDDVPLYEHVALPTLLQTSVAVTLSAQ